MNSTSQTFKILTFKLGRYKCQILLSDNVNLLQDFVAEINTNNKHQLRMRRNVITRSCRDFF